MKHIFFDEFLLIIRIRKQAVNSAKKLGEEVLNKDNVKINKLIRNFFFYFFLYTSPNTRCPSGCSLKVYSNFLELCLKLARDSKINCLHCRPHAFKACKLTRPSCIRST